MSIQTGSRTLLPLLLLLTLVLSAGCVPPAIPVATPGTSGTTGTPEGASVNVAAMAGLADTEKIEISQLAGSPDAGYELAATITDPTVIAAIVDALDTSLTLGPRVQCVDQYKLRFYLADDTTYEFGYFCEPDGSFLHGDPPFLQGHDVQPPERFHQLIQEQIQ